MKVSRKILSFALALALILSMAVMASAATITETYYYTVTKTSTSSTTSMVSDVMTNHVQGTADSIPYSVSAKTYTFNTSIFPSNYRSQLLQAYSAEGLLQSLTVKAESGYKTIPASATTGAYSVVLIYRTGNGVWSVSTNSNATLTSGTFTSAPISYTILASRNT